MNLLKIIHHLLINKITHFGEIYRLISFNHFVKLIKLDLKNHSILDVGFNKGLFRWYFTDLQRCSEYMGVEIDDKYLGIYPNTSFHDFEKNKLNKEFDLIFCSHVLEHIKNDHQFLKNMAHSLINVNAKLILRVPIPTSTNIHFRKYNKRSHKHEEHVRNGYTYLEIKKILEGLGYKINISFTSMGTSGLVSHTFFEVLRDYGLRFQRIFQLPFIFISLIDLYICNNTSPSDLIVLASPLK